MRIAISSTQLNGKTTLVNNFLKNWPNYNLPKSTYRDNLDGLKLNQLGDLESQKVIRESLIDQAIDNSGEKYCLHDRCILDNLVYTLWLSEKSRITDESFIADTFNLTRECLKYYDIIFWLPIDDSSPVNFEDNSNANRDKDEVFRYEINSIFRGISDTYKETTGLVFPIKDSPALIELAGDELRGEKTEAIKQYLDKNGDLNISDESAFKTLLEIAEEENLASDLINQLQT